MVVAIKHRLHKVFLLWHHHWKGDQPKLNGTFSPRGKTDSAVHQPSIPMSQGEIGTCSLSKPISSLKNLQEKKLYKKLQNKLKNQCVRWKRVSHKIFKYCHKAIDKTTQRAHSSNSNSLIDTSINMAWQKHGDVISYVSLKIVFSNFLLICRTSLYYMIEFII